MYTWAEYGMQKPLARDFLESGKQLYNEPFRGVTVSGEPEPGLYQLRDESAPTKAMVEAAISLLAEADSANITESLRFPLEAREWRCWLNPEFYFAQHGVRLEETSESVRGAVEGLIRASLSERGFRDVQSICRVNRFLGDLVGASNLMNEHSYNIILFGEPSLYEPWGWSLWGHHLTFCVLVIGGQMVISPVFRGCEPNIIDVGNFAGTEMFAEDMHLATQMIQTLSESERESVILFDSLEHPNLSEGLPHPADGRNLAGAYQDNRIIPYAGGNIGTFSAEAQRAILALVSKFIDFLPEGPHATRMADVTKHLQQTWLLWMGGIEASDVFHFRIHNPVIMCEFDHECGMYLTNREPRQFHVHTVVRTPNGNDYGKELIRLWKCSKA